MCCWDNRTIKRAREVLVRRNKLRRDRNVEMYWAGYYDAMVYWECDWKILCIGSILESRSACLCVVEAIDSIVQRVTVCCTTVEIRDVTVEYAGVELCRCRDMLRSTLALRYVRWDVQ